MCVCMCVYIKFFPEIIFFTDVPPSILTEDQRILKTQNVPSLFAPMLLYFSIICILFCFPPHCPMVCLTFSPLSLPALSSVAVLRGGHKGDNANTDLLNREWEEDSCSRWQWWLLNHNLSPFPQACCTRACMCMHARTHTHTRLPWLISFCRGHNVTATLPTVKHKCESTHFTTCVISPTYINAQTLYNSQLVAHEQWVHGETHSCEKLEYRISISIYCISICLAYE